MRVLIDECTPRALKKLFMDEGHECSSVQEAGWAGKQNGELLRLAEAAFDVLVTIDTKLSYQQNLAGRKIAIVLIQSSSNRLDTSVNSSRPAFPPSIRSSPAKSFVSVTQTKKKKGIWLPGLDSN